MADAAAVVGVGAKPPKRRQQGKKRPVAAANRRGIEGEAQASAAAVTPRTAAVISSISNLHEWDRRVFDHQQSLFEGAVESSVLIGAAKFLRPHQYQEVVVERAASYTCGYPICSNDIKEMPGRYRISSRELKVYEITELKFFCSAACFASSQYLKAQLPEDPAYMRNLSKMEITLIPLGAKPSHEPSANIVTEPSIDKLREEYVATLLSRLRLDFGQAPGASTVATADNFNGLKIVEKELQLPKDVTTVGPSVGSGPADSVEGFVIRYSRKARRKPRAAPQGPEVDEGEDEQEEPTTELLPEYAEKRKARTRERTARVRWADEARNFPEQSAITSAVTSSERVHPNQFPTGLEAKSLSTAAAPVGVRPGSAPKSVFSSKVAPTAGEVAIPDTSDVQQAVSELAWLKPSRRAPKPKLTVFGRAWTLLESMITEETRTLLDTGAQPDPYAVAQNLAEWGVDLDALAVRKGIFSQRLLRTMTAFCTRHAVATPIRDDCLSIFSTMYLRQSSAMLSPAEEVLICAVLLRALARQSSMLSEELTGKWPALVAETGLTADEVDALARSFYRR
ncbi:RNA polymerase II associated protein 2 [Cladochytrium tenue]|nr:RNA polymerase II associated protein 2 [Cladochytrium tenue]